ncbi:MAG: sulfur transferase domain-containing protein [Pseudomonadota bacterium]
MLRRFWTHEYEIAPGVWRSNQPSPGRIANWAKRGIASVLLLRGKSAGTPFYDLEREACEHHGLVFRQLPVGGGVLVPQKRLTAILDAFRTLEKPFVFHCKSGIDRTGFVAFLYLVAETDTPPEIARRQLSFKYLHVRMTRHGILDLVVDTYLAAYRATGISIRDWIGSEYDPSILTAAYKSGVRAA